MPVSLAEASRNAQTDLDVSVIDEFRKESIVLDTLIFDDAVNPAGGGATLTYGYRRLTTQPTAATRAINTEYAAQNVETQHYTVNLAVLGGAFAVDRVLARIGPAASGAVSLNLQQKIKATRTLFQDLVINGDTLADAAAFDGLDKALTGSDTEFRASQVTDWRTFSTVEGRLSALDDLDEFLSLLDGTPTVLLANKKTLAKIRSIVRGTSLYVREPVEGLVGQNGRPIYRESYGGIIFADPGERAGTTDPIIPIETRTVGGQSTTGLTDIYAYRVGLDGFHGVTTVGSQLVQTWLPDFSSPGAVKSGEVELGPVAVVLKATKAAAVWRNIRVEGT